MAPDPSLLAGLDPFDLMDEEAGRIHAFYASLPPEGWSAPTACAAWDRKDLLAHLAASEEYNRACREDAIAALMADLTARGATDLDSFNAIGVADRAHRSPDELLAEFDAANAETRVWLRAHRGESMPTMVGPYPVDWQAIHLANELAVHADDAGVPVGDAEAAGRLDWMARFVQFALTEHDRDVAVEPVDGGFRVVSGDAEAVVRTADLVAAANGRLPAGHPLDAAIRSALALMG